MFFPTGRSDLSGAARGTIVQLAAFLRAHTGIRRIRIEGHASASGDVARNQVLSEERATHVREALTAHGLDAAALTSVGLGQLPGNSPAVRLQNQRVDFRVLEIADDGTTRRVPAFGDWLGDWSGSRGVNVHVGRSADDVWVDVRDGAPAWLGTANGRLRCYAVSTVEQRLAVHCRGAEGELTILLLRRNAPGATALGWIVAGQGANAHRLSFEGQLGCPSALHACGGICRADDDAANCGASCAACAATEHGTPVCEQSACTVRCNAGFHPCSGRCVDDHSAAACGSNCTQCAAPEHAHATCEQGTCGIACEPGYEVAEGACRAPTGPAPVAATAAVETPRAPVVAAAPVPTQDPMRAAIAERRPSRILYESLFGLLGFGAGYLGLGYAGAAIQNCSGVINCVLDHPPPLAVAFGIAGGYTLASLFTFAGGSFGGTEGGLGWTFLGAAVGTAGATPLLVLAASGAIGGAGRIPLYAFGFVLPTVGAIVGFEASVRRVSMQAPPTSGARHATRPLARIVPTWTVGPNAEAWMGLVGAF